MKSCLVLLLLAEAVHGQIAASDARSERALQEFREEKYLEAERDFREIVRTDFANVFAQFYLGQTLFREEKYADAAVVYERAGAGDRDRKIFSSDQHRILTDQLVMAYGISGQLKKSRDLLEEAIKADPEYPLNYYNLACAFAEDGDKSKTLANLTLAFQRKDHVLRGEHMPDPRSDSSFQKYLQDQDFLKLMKELGYK
jgi:predicted Zn-dependent protease